MPIELPPLDPRLPKWAELEPRVCPVCGQPPDGESAVRPDGLVVNRCRCGLWFVSPAPTEAALAAFYEGYARHARWGHRPRKRATAVLKSLPDTERLPALAEALGGLDSRTVLDVGFGAGHDLVRLNAMGATAIGLEVDSDAVEFAQRHLNLTAVHGNLSDYPASSVDAVLLHDVLEHPLEPMEMLRDAHRVLRPGGVLSVWTPNGDAVDADTERITFRVDLEHMQYFGTDVLRRAAITTGFASIFVRTLGKPDVSAFASPRHGARVIRWAGRTVLPPALRRRLRRSPTVDVRDVGSYHLFGLLVKS